MTIATWMILNIFHSCARERKTKKYYHFKR